MTTAGHGGADAATVASKMANSLKHLLCFLLGAAAAVVCMLSYISMHEDGITEVAQASKIETQSREVMHKF